ncbi:polysaccharide lyase beta-sandwich domain-containing protein [Bacteroides sp. BFG-551]|nr:polysaccharide lyase beta-sandwich domain-containing protein [Bacteroides sp. BFG-551]
MGALKNSPWDKKLTDENIETLLNFIRGSNWYYYKGNITPYIDRFTARYTPAKVDIRTLAIVDKLLKDWSDSFTPVQKNELRCFLHDARKRLISMNGYSDGMYNGTRWFFNNDDLIKKNDRYHMIVNMASVRCDGLESAVAAADEYNFYPADGMTLFQKSGNEYRKAIGAWDITMTPGVTAREGAEKLIPVTNWRGYCSKHNYAAASTNGGENAVAGYIFEKMDATDKIESERKKNIPLKNEILYGVKAYKSYFMLKDYMVALGAGITNLTPQMQGTIRTTIDQPEKESEVVVWSNGKILPVGAGMQSFPKDGTSFRVVQKGKFAYSILPQYTKNASFICETLKTDWVKRNSANKSIKDLPSQVDILRLWIDHTQNPVNDTYGYVVYAGDGMPEAELPFEVLRNDTLVQAVKSKDGKVIEAVFYQSGEVLDKGDVRLEVSAPCTVLIEDINGKITISVTDAAMNAGLKEIVLQWNGRHIPVAMPQGAFCGKPANITL